MKLDLSNFHTLEGRKKLRVSDNVEITTRMRLECKVFRSGDELDRHLSSTRIDDISHSQESSPVSPFKVNRSGLRLLSISNDQVFSDLRKNTRKTHLTSNSPQVFHILNDIVVDRGPSAYMCQLEVFSGDNHLTTSQADGLVIATPTGSTAYSVKRKLITVECWRILNTPKYLCNPCHSNLSPLSLIPSNASSNIRKIGDTGPR